MKDPTYREAIAVLLHDQRLIISTDVASYATDSFWTGSNVEYQLTVHLVEALTKILHALNLPAHKLDTQPLGFYRAYTNYGLKGLQRIEVLETDRGLRFKLYVDDGTDVTAWVEEWSYSGAYTVIWPL